MRLLKILIFYILLVLLVGCKTTIKEEEKVVEFGKTITFDYAAGFDNGTLFDTSFEVAAIEAGIYNSDRLYKPERAVLGKDPLIPGLAEALLGMGEGDVKNIRIPPNKAYGNLIENAAITMPKDSLNSSKNLKINDLVAIGTPKDQKIPAYIKEIGKENITVDLNHPLAGNFIQFAIILRSIEY